MSYLDPPATSRRFAGLVVVVIFHALLLYALLTGLARKVVEVVMPPLETRLLEEIKPPADDPVPPPPLPPPPKPTSPPLPVVPPPEVRIDTPPVVAPSISVISENKPAAEVAAETVAPQPGAASRTAAVVDARGCAKPDYPVASLRAQESGIVALSFLIGVDGAVLDSKVTKSSGSRRLDEAARRALALCSFKPATVDGKPEQSWARIEYEWKIE